MVIRRRYRILLAGFLLASLSFPACVKDKPDSPEQPPATTSGRKIWVANEGSLGNGNASLSVLLPERDSIYNHVFKTANHQDLGDVFQSMTPVGNRLFLAVNNSDVIKVINRENYELMATIDVRKPRYMLWVDSTKMYVSSLFYPEINVINPRTFQVTGQIAADYPNTEGLLAFQGKVYACNWDTACRYLYEIDPDDDQITHRIPIAGAAPQQVLADKEGQLWVLAGNAEQGKPATLTRINPVSRSITRSYHFPPKADVLKPAWNPGRDTLYFLGVDYNGRAAYNGVFRMSINQDTLPQTPFIPSQPLQYFWGLGIDPATGKIYVGDPKGFLQQGSILVYGADGVLQQSFSCGIGPGFFLFDH